MNGRDPITVAQARWRTAEDKLYPMVMIDPDRFRQVLEAVRALVDELRSRCRTLEDLLDIEAAPGELLAVLPANRGPLLPEELMVQAACGMRGREVVAAAEAERRAAVVAAARAAGQDWVVLEGPEHLEDLIGNRRTELHLPTGRVLVATVDPYLGEEPFQLEELVMDIAADRPDRTRAAGRTRSFADRAAWTAERDRWRAEIGSP